MRFLIVNNDNIKNIFIEEVWHIDFVTKRSWILSDDLPQFVSFQDM